MVGLARGKMWDVNNAALNWEVHDGAMRELHVQSEWMEKILIVWLRC